MRRLLVLALAAGCGKHLNPEWCAQPGHSDPQCSVAVDAPPPACKTEQDCMGAACLPTGACADPSTILYASPTGSGTACTVTAKCLLPDAIAVATPARNVIVLDPTTFTGPISIDRAVQLIGKNATLGAAGSGPAVTVASTGAVELDYLTITGATAASGLACTSGTLHAHAITVTGNQVGITSACELTLDRSLVVASSNGALAITAGAIDVRNNFIVNNGSTAVASQGNVAIANGVTGSFAFNTVAYNTSKQNGTPGVVCDSTAVVGEGNIVTDNDKKGVFDVSPQVSGTCDFTKSYTANGVGNNDLHWANVATSDFHLTAASTPVLDVPGLTCDARDDYDGEARPMGTGCDYGADELTR